MSNGTVLLTHFESVAPPITLSQDEALEFTLQAHLKTQPGQAEFSRNFPLWIRRYGIKSKDIATRLFENIDLPLQGADIEERTLFFSRRGREVFSQLYPKKSTHPQHIIHVTCTGYVSPSPAQWLVNDQNWNGKTNITHSYHMGCYAALPSVRVAEGLIKAKEQRVDIVHTEMCALHNNPRDHSPEQIVVQSLFADGHIKYSALPLTNQNSGFEVLGISELIVKDSQEDMTWSPASWGMKMSLSREVPAKIASNLRPFLKQLLASSSYSVGEVLKHAVFAIHPGGPKIIDSVQQVLELSNEQTEASKEILRTRGNMSSATLPHVWKKLLDDSIKHDQLVVSLAFGPGLTIFGSIFKAV
ncbi:MAG: 3-oxoacyl-[acyl-carrier-protein] synthase III C-terminal domain-containing protein [Bdellovibrionota bacterium]